jgi:dolichol kinase
VLCAWFVGWVSPSRTVSIGVLTAMSAGALALDVLRFAWPPVNVLFFRFLSRLASPREAAGIASSTWYMVGITLAAALFPVPHAVGGILVLALADPSASYVGQRWGRHKLGTGSWEGTAVFVAVAIAVLFRAWPLPHVLVTVAVATVVERSDWGLDDNLTLPLAVAGTLWVLGVL